VVTSSLRATRVSGARNRHQSIVPNIHNAQHTRYTAHQYQPCIILNDNLFPSHYKPPLIEKAQHFKKLSPFQCEPQSPAHPTDPSTQNANHAPQEHVNNFQHQQPPIIVQSPSRQPQAPQPSQSSHHHDQIATPDTNDDDDKNANLSTNNSRSSSSKAGKVLAASAAMMFVPTSYAVLPMDVTILSTLPMITNTLLQMAPFHQFREIAQTKSTADYSPIPYMSMLSNSALWFLYGISTGNTTLILSYLTAVSSAAVCTAVFAKHNTKPENSAVMKKYGILSGSLLGALTYGAFCTDLGSMIGMDAAGMLGTVGVATAVMAYVSPLSVMKSVIQNKSASALPFGLCSAMALNAATWFCYGWFITDDIYLWIPGLLGVTAGLTQLTLLAIY